MKKDIWTISLVFFLLKIQMSCMRFSEVEKAMTDGYIVKRVTFVNCSSELEKKQQSSIQQALSNARSISGPVKSMENFHLLLLNNEGDSLIAYMYGDNKVFSMNNLYYKSNENILPQKLLNTLRECRYKPGSDTGDAIKLIQVDN